MELKLKKAGHDYYEGVAWPPFSCETMRECIVPDSCADIARIVDTAGLVCLTGRELTGDGRFCASGTVEVAVLYIPEKGDGPCALRFQIPFQCCGEGQDAAAYSLQVLEILGIQGESLSVQADSGEEDAVTVVCRQLWNQVPVFNHLITLTFRGDSLSAVEGRRLTGEPVLDTGQKPISIPTALFQFYHGMVALGDVCSRIDSITPGYVTSAGTGPSALTPVWYIATDTRNYRLDTLTGELSRAEESGA